MLRAMIVYQSLNPFDPTGEFDKISIIGTV